jgi:hypothetical protein
MRRAAVKATASVGREPEKLLRDAQKTEPLAGLAEHLGRRQALPCLLVAVISIY